MRRSLGISCGEHAGGPQSVLFLLRTGPDLYTGTKPNPAEDLDRSLRHFAVLQVRLSRYDRTEGAKAGMMCIYDSLSSQKPSVLRRWALHVAAVRKWICGFGRGNAMQQPIVVDVVQQDGMAMDCGFHTLL